MSGAPSVSKRLRHSPVAAACASLAAACRLRSLSIMVAPGTNSSRFGTQFTVSVEARHGVTTGVSAADRDDPTDTASDPGSDAGINPPGKIEFVGEKGQQLIGRHLGKDQMDAWVVV